MGVQNWRTRLIKLLINQELVLNGIEVKNKLKQLINADSRVIIAWESDSYEQVFEEMYSVWQEQDDQTKNNFREIFE